MDPDTIAPLIALVGLGVFTLAGMRMFLAYRIRRFEAQRRGHPHELEESITELRDQVHLLRNDVVELQERMDFTERVLTRGQGNERPIAEA
jgi:hypothetical protein